MARPKKISMQTVADRLGISKNAVSLALSGKKGVSEEVRRSVLAAAKEVGYDPSGADGRAGRASRNVLVLVPERVVSYADDEHFRFFHDMLWSLEESIRAKGCNAVIARIDREMEEGLILPGVFEDVEHIGVILFGIVAKPYARKVWESGVPLVMLDSYYRDLPCAAAVSANTEGAEAAVRWLIGRGHRQIGFIGPANLTTSHEERWFGYWRAMREAGLPIDQRHTLLEASDFDMDENEREIGEFLARMGFGASSGAKADSGAEAVKRKGRGRMAGSEAEEIERDEDAAANEAKTAERKAGAAEGEAEAIERKAEAAELLPTAFFCGNDRLALLLIRRLRALGGSAAEQAEVVGFDGLEQASEAGSGVSATVRVDKRGMGEAAVELLLGGYGSRREAVRWAAAGSFEQTPKGSLG
ncbi:substrate-binding domain-containing protein [Saccharibacillus sp. O23]|uniref:substrate-binding domain-containing protein n=1 Tax=Saccharibacillus sp. O23 TaxID=2009338 RepID=UPI00211AF7EE|nr:substrate-binding domain-containing protein [Saccharibacillus sp. O23]